MSSLFGKKISGHSARVDALSDKEIFGRISL
jgi:hypothetical protein